jgi:hypothetical protein
MCEYACSGEQPIEVSWITWWYQLPRPLAASPPSNWQLPVYELPPHCEKIREGAAGQLNVAFLSHANHPCTFLQETYYLPSTLEDLLPSQAQLP